MQSAGALCVLAQNITPKNKHYVRVGQGLNRVVCTDGTEKVVWTNLKIIQW